MTEEEIKHREYMIARRKAANEAFLHAMDSQLELLREDVAGIVSTVQLRVTERSQHNKINIDALRADHNALANKVELLSVKLTELKDLVLSVLGEK